MVRVSSGVWFFFFFFFQAEDGIRDDLVTGVQTCALPIYGGVVADKWSRRNMSASHNPQVINERRNTALNKGDRKSVV